VLVGKSIFAKEIAKEIVAVFVKELSRKCQGSVTKVGQKTKFVKMKYFWLNFFGKTSTSYFLSCPSVILSFDLCNLELWIFTAVSRLGGGECEKKILARGNSVSFGVKWVINRAKRFSIKSPIE
jgi:hypothetical protein